jgi:protein ImuB
MQLPAASTLQARALAEACLRFSSQVALRQAQAGAPAVFLEARRSGWLYAPESLAWRVQAAARRLGLPQPWQLGWGAHPAEAYAQARWGPALVALPDQSIRRLPLDALQAYASPFIEHGEAEQAVAGFVQVFRELGLSDLGAFLDLPLRSLETRFGAQAALLRSRVAGHWDMAWPRFEAAVVLEELADTRQVETQDGISAGEALLFHVKELCDRVSARLGGRGQRAAGLRLSLGMQRLGTRGIQWRQIDVALPMPQAGALGLLRVLRERIESEWRLRPLAGAITQVALMVSASAPGLGAQRHLWDKKEEETEAWAALINRLRQRLGEDEVFLGELVQRYLPERAWKRLPPHTSVGAGSPRPVPSPVPRPTRLLPQALPLLRQGDLLAHASTGRRWHVRAWQGPERLSGEWWDDPAGLGFARDYFKVDTQEGEQLWVYQITGPGGASLWWQGVFD